MKKMDAQTEALLKQFNTRDLPPLSSIPLEQSRSFPSMYRYESDAPLKKVVDVPIEVSSGEIDLRIFIPHGDGPFPVFINIHGGGWTFGNLASTDGESTEIAHQANCIVVTIDYHLAPENKFPIPLNDCYEASMWVKNNIHEYNGDPDRLAIGGMSAGANLAAAVALKARDTKELNFLAQILIVPCLTHDFTSESYDIYAKGYVLTTESMKWFWGNYLNDRNDDKNPYACPLQAESLQGLPPALIITAEFDPLRDDSYAYAKRLEEDDIPVIQKTYPSIHGFTGMADRLDIAKEATSFEADYLQSLFEATK